MDDSFDVVISGIGGHFPECDDVDTLMEKLRLGKSLITYDDRRWVPGKLGVDAHIGKVSNFDYFDNQFFGIHRPLTTVMDPITRLLLERVQEAVIDAGLHPHEFYGTKTSVFSSCTISENEATFLFSKNRALAFTIVGANRSMMANRVSFYFNLNGKSCAYDGTWCWAALGLQMAYTAIKSGECDSVIVGGTSLCLHPELSVLYSGMNYLSPDGVCKPFDADANGSVRAESQVVFLLQRSDQAKRAYAKVLGARMLFDGSPHRDLLSPTVDAVSGLIDGLYKDMDIDKKKVDYVECYGTGYQPTDYAEVEGLRKSFCAEREQPLLIGSAKGNAGHSEGPAGMVSLVKVMHIFRSGVIPKTLNYTTPNPKIPSLADGRIRVVAQPTPLNIQDDTIIGSTSISFTGHVGHVVLGAASKNKVAVDQEKELPRLILVCGRTEQGVRQTITKISRVPFDPEYYRLVQDIFTSPLKSYQYRSHVVCPSPPNTPIKVELGSSQTRPVWFIFSGMGSQWAGMGRDLLRIPAFKATIDRCHAVLEKKGLDLRKILTHPNEDIFDDILNSFVGIAAVQVGLINILRLLEIEPEGFIGHSVGEQACAYMDGCINEEETMLAAYARGAASNEADLIRGMMAAVGMGYHQTKDQLPKSIEVACHNSNDNCTISGPADDVNDYVEQLKKRNIFARTVNVSNTAYHSRYVADAGPILMRRLSEVITEPKERSPRWISTSAPKEAWATDDGRFCSAKYLTNNLLGAVLFEEAMAYVPDDAILIEIAPHGLLQAILRRSTTRGTTNISLARRDAEDGVGMLYSAIAKMYVEGLCPKVANLYPDIEFPVSRQTPSTANLCTWKHSERFYATTDAVLEKEDYRNIFNVNLETPAEILRGSPVCLPSYFMSSIWSILSNMRRFGTNEMPIEFNEVRFFEPFSIPSEGEKKLHFSVQKNTGLFEISDNALIVSGQVLTASDVQNKKLKPNEGNIPESTLDRDPNGSTVTMSAVQLYSELASRGHTYKSDLMCISSVDMRGDVWTTKVRHGGEVVAVLAACFQISQLHNAQESQICVYPKYLDRLKFNPKTFFGAYPHEAEITFYTKLGRIVSTSLSLGGLEFRPLQTEPPRDLKLQASSLSFFSYETTRVKSLEDIASIALQLSVERQPTLQLGVGILELNNGSGTIHNLVLNDLRKLALEHHNIDVILQKIKIDKHGPLKALPVGSKTCGIIISEQSTAAAAVSLLDHCPSAMILAYVRAEDKATLAHFKNLKILVEYVEENGRVRLLGRKTPPSPNTHVIMVPQNEPIPTSINVTTGAIYVWTAMPPMGVRKVVDEITKLPRGGAARMVFILDEEAPKFSTSLPLYHDQLALDMRVNVLQDGKWGSYRALPLPKDAHDTPNGKESLLIAVSTEKVGDTTISHWGLEPLSATAMGTEIGLDYSGNGPTGRVFGVAKAVNGQPHLDPNLQWSVPQSWTSAEAATVPLAYCQALIALRRRTRKRRHDNILVTAALRPEGQAAVRVALATPEYVKVFAIVRDEKELSIMQRLFKDAVGVKKLHLICADEKNLRIELLKKVSSSIKLDIIVTSNPDEVCMDTLSILSDYGRLVNIGGAHTPFKRSIGMYPFVNTISLAFFSVQSVLNMKEYDKASVHADIAEGLKPNGFVRPLRHVIHSNDSTVSALWNDSDFYRNKVVLASKPKESPAYVFKHGSSCLIAGADPRQTIHLANWSAKRGIKNIVAVHPETQSPFLLRHAHLLSAVYGTTLHIVKDLSGGLQQSLQTGTLAIMFAAAYDQTGQNMAEKMTKFPVSVPLVVLVAKGTDHGVLEESCSGRHLSKGRTFLLIGQMEEAISTRMLDWLLRTENSLPVTLLQSATDARSQRIPGAHLLKLLPEGTESLAAWGRSLLPSEEPELVEMATDGPSFRFAKEVFPLIVIPGISASIDTAVRPLAEKLLVPLFCVRFPQRLGEVVDLSHKIVQLIRNLQPHGPYSLLGFDWTAPLTHQIAAELHKTGCHVTMYLVDGDPSDATQVASLSRRPDFEGLLLSSLDLQVNSSTYAEVCALPSWREKLHHLRPTYSDEKTREEAECALNAIRGWALSLAQHEMTPCQVETHLIQSSAPLDVAYAKTSTLKVARYTEPHNLVMSTGKVQQYLNEYMAYPALQTNDARIERVK